jgi:hypothetical protein
MNLTTDLSSGHSLSMISVMRSVKKSEQPQLVSGRKNKIMSCPSFEFLGSNRAHLQKQQTLLLRLLLCRLLLPPSRLPNPQKEENKSSSENILTEMETKDRSIGYSSRLHNGIFLVFVFFFLLLGFQILKRKTIKAVQKTY